MAARTYKIFAIILIIFTTAFVTSGQALQVQVYPGDRIYVQQANPNHNYFDLVIHNIVFVNDAMAPVDIENAEVEVLQGNLVVESRLLSQSEIEKTTAEISGNGQLAGGQLDTDFPSLELREQNISLAKGAHLEKAQAAVAKNIFLTVQGMPSTIRIHVKGKSPQGEVEATGQVPVWQKESQNQYHIPLHGIWFMRSVPNITSHHRWNTQTEFAVDFWKLGENGWLWKSDGKSGSDFYGFGEPVLAAADGIVVRAENEAVQNYEVRLKKKDETEEQYGERLTKYNLEMLKADPYKSILGNHVVIQHSDGEFSSYAHLKTGSVKVKKGDHVVSGQQIGEVGDTGDTYLVHLHFQISDGPDPLKARSIPFTLVDLRQSDPDLGRIVRTK